MSYGSNEVSSCNKYKEQRLSNLGKGCYLHILCRVELMINAVYYL